MRVSLKFLLSLNFSHRTSTNDYIYVHLCSTFNVKGHFALFEGITVTLLQVPHSHKPQVQWINDTVFTWRNWEFKTMTQDITGEGVRSLNLKLLNVFFMQKPAMSYLLLGLQLTHWCQCRIMKIWASLSLWSLNSDNNKNRLFLSNYL